MNPMSAGIEEDLLARLRGLPPDRQREVLDFAEFLARQPPGDTARGRTDVAEVIASLRGGKRTKEEIDRQLAEERDWDRR